MCRDLIFLMFVFGVFSVTVFSQNKSVYTDLTPAKCRTVEGEPGMPGKYSGQCPGVSDYDLEVHSNEDQASLGVVLPSKKVVVIDFRNYFDNYSWLRGKAEWRLKSREPLALIVRLDVNDQGERGSTSYLIVSKISATDACVTDVVKPGRNQNLLARRLADKALAQACKKIMK